MGNKIDNIVVSCLKAMAFVVAASSILVSGTARADYRPYSAYRPYIYNEMYGYDEELEQCVDLLRPTMDAAPYERTEYVVENIRLHGPWYRFEITASVYGLDGETNVDGFKVLCKSNRWIESSRLIARRNTASVDRELVVKNTSELLAYQAKEQNDNDALSANAATPDAATR